MQNYFAQLEWSEAVKYKTGRKIKLKSISINENMEWNSFRNCAHVDAYLQVYVINLSGNFKTGYDHNIKPT